VTLERVAVLLASTETVRVVLPPSIDVVAALAPVIVTFLSIVRDSEYVPLSTLMV
jgi:hypothetical protein